MPRVEREPPRQAINDDMIDISKYFPRDGAHRAQHRPASVFRDRICDRHRLSAARHLFKCNISPPNEDYLAGKCVPQVHRPSSSILPFVPSSSRCHANEGPFVYPLPIPIHAYIYRDINKKFYVRYFCKSAI